jgi:hypothetical protein
VGQALALTHQYRHRQYPDMVDTVNPEDIWLPPRRSPCGQFGDEGATMNSTSKEGEWKLETNRAASGSSPIMTAVVKKRVGNNSTKNASYSSRKTALPLFRVFRGREIPRKTR